MIDGIDGCGNTQELLRQLKTLTCGLNGTVGRQHIMLCGRNDLFVSNVFSDCLNITTTFTESEEDQAFYIDTEIDHINQLQPGSLFFSPQWTYANRLQDVLKRKGGGLFRWIEIQIDIFTNLRNDFMTADQIEDELSRLENHTADDELDKEYARLLDRLKKSKRNHERAIKMLRLVACLAGPLTIDALAEALTASEHDSSGIKLTLDDVRRILAGFVSERRWMRNSKGVNIYESTVHLAHSSVLEYLTNNKDDPEQFFTLAQQSEAASPCFSRISYQLQFSEGLFPSTESSSDQISTMEVLDFLAYSCCRWPKHCRRAFDEDNKCTLVELARDFIFSDAYPIWNSVVRYGVVHYDTDTHHLAPLHALQRLLDDVWHDSPSPKPGFVLTAFDLKELLDFSEIQALISLQDVKGAGTNLLSHSLLYATPSMVARLVELYPEQVKLSEGQEELLLAIKRTLAKVVKRLLKKGEVTHIVNGFGTPVLRDDYQFIEMRFNEYEQSLQIIRILLERGANFYQIYGDQTAWHLAAIYKTPGLLNLFIENARQLDEREQNGNVQRSLRMRDRFGRTPVDHATGANVQYLDDQLEEAVKRDGRVMYNVDSPAPMAQPRFTLAPPPPSPVPPPETPAAP